MINALMFFIVALFACLPAHTETALYLCTKYSLGESEAQDKPFLIVLQVDEVKAYEDKNFVSCELQTEEE